MVEKHSTQNEKCRRKLKGRAFHVCEVAWDSSRKCVRRTKHRLSTSLRACLSERARSMRSLERNMVVCKTRNTRSLEEDVRERRRRERRMFGVLHTKFTQRCPFAALGLTKSTQNKPYFQNAPVYSIANTLSSCGPPKTRRTRC